MDDVEPRRWKNTRGAGPVYFLLHDIRHPRLFGVSEMIEVDPPFRHGKGVFFTLGNTVFEFGLCRRAKPEAPDAESPTRDYLDEGYDVAERAVGARTLDDVDPADWWRKQS